MRFDGVWKALLLVTLHSVVSDLAYSDCVAPSSTVEAFREADVVFTGKVKGLGKDGHHVVSVIKSYKGKSPPKLNVVRTASDKDDAAFESGGRYLIFGHIADGGAIRAMGCGVSRPIASAKADLIELEKGFFDDKNVLELLKQLADKDTQIRRLAIAALHGKRRDRTKEAIAAERGAAWAIANDGSETNRVASIMGFSRPWHLETTFDAIKTSAPKMGRYCGVVSKALAAAPAPLCSRGLSVVAEMIKDPPKGCDRPAANFGIFSESSCRLDALRLFLDWIETYNGPDLAHVNDAIAAFLARTRGWDIESETRLLKMARDGKREYGRYVAMKLLQDFFRGLGPEARALLKERAFTEPSELVRDCVIEVLSEKSEHPFAREVLCKIFKNDPSSNIRRHAEDAIGAYSDDSEDMAAKICKK